MNPHLFHSLIPRARIWTVFLSLSIASFVFTLPCPAQHSAKKDSMKKGILLVAFGTSEPAAQTAYDNLSRQAAKRFADIPVRWAYTSGMIRRKLAGQGKLIDSPVTALAKMHDEGFTHVAVQSLHVVAGIEYEELREAVRLFGNGPSAFNRITLGQPLLGGNDDLQRTAKALLAEIPKQRQSNEAVILMGHGTGKHPADLAYVAAAAVFNQLDRMTFLGTVEGSPSFETVAQQCKAAGVKKAWLMPFMAVAGDHARNDMSGDDKDSWKSLLAAQGIQSECVLKGIAEYDSVAAIWMDHLAEAITRPSADSLNAR
ncbi:MAG: sirohydrochlorin cobaltochelatase [Verrucomicrobiae bacterium]|nr:sirohydrochlorin cobaltochelatase [Verrucomicrobiae bacterium]